MHYAMGLGVAVLGMVSAVGPNEVVSTGAPESAAAVEHGTDIVVLEGQTTWFNILHVDFLGTNGDWVEEDIDGDTVLLRPQDDECSFGLHLQWNDQIVYFPMDKASELAFDGTWIKVDQLGRGIVLSGSHEGEFPSSVGAAFVADCSSQIAVSQVASMDLNGTCWQSDLTPGEGCSMSQSCNATEEGGICRLRVTTLSGTSAPGMNFNAECGSTVTVSECQVSAGRMMLCVSN